MNKKVIVIEFTGSIKGTSEFHVNDGESAKDSFIKLNEDKSNDNLSFIKHLEGIKETNGKHIKGVSIKVSNVQL